MSFGEIGRGLRDLKLFPLTGETIGTGVDWPGARSLEWSADQDSEQLEGDDTIIATALDAAIGSGSIEVGRVNLAAVAAARGGTAVTAGTVGAQTITLVETATGGENYVMVVGQSMSRDMAGSAYRAVLHKAQIAALSESMTVKEWNTPTADITFFENDAQEFITRIQYETAIDIPTTWV